MVHLLRGRLGAPMLLLIGLLALLTPLASPAFAQTGPADAAAPAFVLSPKGETGPYFSETMTPGETKTLTVELGNAGAAPVTARTYATDAYTLINGGFGVRPEGTPATGATAWLDYAPATLELAPGQLADRAFKVSVPKDATPGQHIAALVIQTAKPVAVSGSAMLRQTILKSIAVFITVPGALTPKLAIGQASIDPNQGGRVLSVAVENSGNVLLKPEGALTLTDASGATAMTAPVAMGSVYAGMATTIEIALADSVAPGAYSVAVDLADKATGAAASARALPIVVPALNAATPEANPVTVESVALEPARDGSGKLKYVGVDVKIGNTGAAVANARLILHVTLDGKPVEDFPLSAALSVPSGTTDVPARYLPAGDWAAGSYGFSVTLEQVDPGTGQATVLATATAPATVKGP